MNERGVECCLRAGGEGVVDEAAAGAADELVAGEDDVGGDRERDRRVEGLPAWDVGEQVAAVGPNRSGGPGVPRDMTIVRRLVGALLVLVGAVWIGQGLELIGGSSMSGSSFWAAVGALCAVAGLGLLGWPWRQPSGNSKEVR
jgi:hypothetical protein